MNWLKQNNHLYKDFTIPNSDCSFQNAQYDQLTHAMINDLDETTVIDLDTVTPDINVNEAIKYGFKYAMPRNKNKPIDAFDIKYGEEKAFPWLYPFGINGLLQNREISSSFKSMYSKTRFMHASGLWRKDITYLFYASNYYEKIQTIVDNQMLLITYQ